METKETIYSEDQWIQWMDELGENDYALVDDFISQEMFTAIMDFFKRKRRMIY